jgi:hypothetical protein
LDEKKKFRRVLRIALAFAIVILGLFLFKTAPIDASKSINTSIFSAYGTLVGGLIGAFLGIFGISNGEHLLAEKPIEVVAIVESEKTAIIGSGV